MNNIQAVFIDRDGTIGGTGHFIHPKDFSLYPFSIEAFKLLKDHDINMFAFTNQHRISKNQATIREFQEQFKSFGFDDAFICPHNQDAESECRKPRTGLLLDAAKKYNLDLSKCAVIGDVGSTDMLAAHAVGAMKILVQTGWGKSSLSEYRYTWTEAEPDYVAENLLDAVRWLVQ
ncbi:MAG TPA: HAD-IIIA family hydrolase [Bacillus sp. (in: firmicutes)]|nr:HAD-IIIA family hydrolase [Bacillus sp. (in: firmicutes)]